MLVKNYVLSINYYKIITSKYRIVENTMLLGISYTRFAEFFAFEPPANAEKSAF